MCIRDRYQDASNTTYTLATYPSKEACEAEGCIVTHQGKCGSCSTLQDLSVYMGTPDLTTPVRKCGFKGFFSQKQARKCLNSIGFTDNCADIWYYNTVNTKKECAGICMWSWITDEPRVIDDKLNKCLECDEVKSGPVFKYFSGRTRRNSGIKTDIDRPQDQVYNMTHCYY
eukprot:TRINITY_DN852_c0_g1_i4.p2 TRINITY_DN852_c0_g1~~TRINITY_DN852_c0_g1_i4.p2  ORF type:complete len:171 (+),score=57.04 TRINITY_DN852_c0_g1_i4:67-579(+)